MKMSIEEIIKYLPAPICGDTVVGEEKQKEYEAHRIDIIILCKYQKIEQIIDDWEHDVYPTSDDALEDIERILKNDKDNN